MKKPTAIYSMPGSGKFYRITGPINSITPTEIFQESGFVFAPFDTSMGKIYQITGVAQQINPDTLPSDNWIKNDRNVIQTSKTTYQTMFDAAINDIKSGKSEKIVISIREIEDSQIPSMACFLNELRESYPNAFVYLFYIPGKEFWIGASPELLLDTNLPTQSTVALAGTLKDAPDLAQWPEKERIEHRYVEEFIEEVISDWAFQKVGPHPVKAGPVYHLKSGYTIRGGEGRINPFDLHPGPALSGYPVYPALESIKRIEESSRRYYTGFLGPVWRKGSSRFYVNIRCLEILENYSVLYAGGGLTEDSDADKEWVEIQDKLSTLRSKIYKGQEIT